MVEPKSNCKPFEEIEREFGDITVTSTTNIMFSLKVSYGPSGGEPDPLCEVFQKILAAGDPESFDPATLTTPDE